MNTVGTAVPVPVLNNMDVVTGDDNAKKKGKNYSDSYVRFNIDRRGGRIVSQGQNGELVVSEHSPRMIDRFKRHKRHAW